LRGIFTRAGQCKVTNVSDQRFTDRVKRIEKRAQRGQPVELMAGVGPIKSAREAAIARSYPLGMLILGAVSGFVALQQVRKHMELSGMTALFSAPQEAIALALANPMAAVSAGWLAFIGLPFVFALLFRNLDGALRTFGFAGMAGMLTQVAYSMADPVALMALVEPYLPAG
jgi:hypothetical protein